MAVTTAPAPSQTKKKEAVEISKVNKITASNPHQSAGYKGPPYREDSYFFDAIYSTKSTTRLEYPHSLSYQERTFTILPPTT